MMSAWPECPIHSQLHREWVGYDKGFAATKIGFKSVRNFIANRLESKKSV